MSHDPAACLGDMLDYARDVEAFVAGMDAEVFAKDRKTQYAVLRALEVIGEAAKRVPPIRRRGSPIRPGVRLSACETSSRMTTSAFA